MGILDGALPGAVSGIIGTLAAKVIGGYWGQPVTDLAVGHFMQNETLETIGGRTIGQYVASGGLGAVGLGSMGNAKVAGLPPMAILV